MRVCFVVSEIFAFGHYGGFGKLTRQIANGLIEKGIEVYVLTPKRLGDQKTTELLDNNLVVIGFPWGIKRLFSVVSLSETKSLYKLPEADIYHSEAPSVDSWLAMKHNPKAKHIITFQDPRTFEERWKVLSLDPEKRSMWKKNRYKFKFSFLDMFATRAIKNADGLYCQARYIIPKVVEMFGLDSLPMFLPNPVDIPERKLKKADQPTVCFLGRWDWQKRPEMFLKLAKESPNVNFIAMGKSHDDVLDKAFREKYSDVPNLEMPGFVTEREKSEVLERSWVMLNTSIRECLPVAFLESLAHKTPIISGEDPDSLVSRFGVKTGYKYVDYRDGLKKFLSSDWEKLGEKGRRYVENTHEYWRAIDRHIKAYKDILEGDQ